MSGLRIAVVELAARGGMAHYAFQLCQGLAAGGAEVTLVTDRRFALTSEPRDFALDACLALWDVAAPTPSGRLSARLRRLGRAIVHYREWLRAILRLARRRPEIVLLGDLRFAGDAACVGLLAAVGLPVADVCHNIERFRRGAFGSSRLERSAYRWLYRRCRRIFVHYESNRTRFLALYGGAPSRVVAIPHGNESLLARLRRPDLSAAQLRQRLGLPAAAPVVLQLGHLSRYKGVELALEAWALVQASVPTARLVLAGRPLPDFDLEAVETRIGELGLEASVLVHPSWVPDDEVAAWMELAAVAWFPYRQVFQSGTLALAQTFGVPCVATRVGAMAEAAGDGARLVAPIAVSLAQAAIALLSDREQAGRLGAAGRRLAETTGDWSLIGARLVRELAAALAGESTGAAALGAEARR